MEPYSLVRLPALGSSPEGAAPRAEAWVTQVPPSREHQKQDSALLSSRVGCTTAPVTRAVLPSSMVGWTNASAQPMFSLPRVDNSSAMTQS